jgi:flagellar biosynthetic protein FliR
MSSLNVMLAQLPALVLVCFRVSGLMIYGPIFGSPIIPPQVKIFLALTLGLAAYPALLGSGAVEAPPLELFALAPLIISELMIGLVLGFAASLPIIGFQTGGLIMGQQMGLGFATFFNPAMGDEADILGQIMFFLAVATFLIIGGHEALILSLLNSFDRIPVGAFSMDADVLSLVAGMLLSSFELALRIAAPLLAIIFLESVAMGFVSKSVPQLNILSLGFPLRILVGMAIIALGLVILHEVLLEAIDTSLVTLDNWLIEAGVIHSQANGGVVNG